MSKDYHPPYPTRFRIIAEIVDRCKVGTLSTCLARSDPPRHRHSIIPCNHPNSPGRMKCRQIGGVLIALSYYPIPPSAPPDPQCASSGALCPGGLPGAPALDSSAYRHVLSSRCHLAPRVGRRSRCLRPRAQLTAGTHSSLCIANDGPARHPRAVNPGQRCRLARCAPADAQPASRAPHGARPPRPPAARCLRQPQLRLTRHGRSRARHHLYSSVRSLQSKSHFNRMRHTFTCAEPSSAVCIMVPRLFPHITYYQPLLCVPSSPRHAPIQFASGARRPRPRQSSSSSPPALRLDFRRRLQCRCRRA